MNYQQKWETVELRSQDTTTIVKVENARCFSTEGVTVMKITSKQRKSARTSAKNR